MTRRFSAAALLLLILPAGAQAQMVLNQAPAEKYRLRLEYRWLRSQLEGEVQRGVLDVPGTDFDMKSDLGFADDRTWEARGTIRIGQSWKLRVGYTRLDYLGNIVLDRTIRYGGTSFGRGEDVTSTLKGGYWAGELEWDIVNRKQGYFGFLGGAQAPDVDTVISSPDTGKRVQDTFRPVSPVIGIAGRAYTGRVSIEVFAKSFPKISGRRVTDAEATARIHLSDRFAIQGGYRYLSFKLEQDPDIANIKVKGWVYGVEVGL